MFIPHHTLVTAPDAAPRRWMMVLHGIYGRGTNWRSFATKLTRRRPDWGLVLVDLRMHGESQDAPGPHTIAAAAADLANLAEALTDREQPIGAIAGHSFGGKVALEFRHGPAGPDLCQTWLFDSSPGATADAMAATDNTVVQVLHMLQRLPAQFADRSAFVREITGRGFYPALGHWLAMNLEAVGGPDEGYRFRLDTDAMAALLGDYYAIDAWPQLADGPGSVQVIIAGASDTLGAADRDRLQTLAKAGAAVTTHVIPGASHWLHVDSLDALLDIVAAGLAEAA